MASRVGGRSVKGVRRRHIPFSVAWMLGELEADYGRSRFIARFDPVEELISCILSQHTADVRSFPTFTELRVKWPDWNDVIAADIEELADVIRPAGLANQKAKSIQSSLMAIKSMDPAFGMGFLRDMTNAEAREWLLALPGVGEKTAAIVLCFALGRHAIPVDTHVHRLSMRLGILAEGTDVNKAHAILEKSIPEELAFSYHTLLIQHGRMRCFARQPECDGCRLLGVCRFGRNRGKLGD